MLNKEILFIDTERSDVFDKKIVGQITSRYSSNVAATGYWKDHVGSCTASEILQMCDQGDSSSLEYYKFLLSTADFSGVTFNDPQQRAALGSFRLLIGGAIIDGFVKCSVSSSGSRYSYVSIAKPRFCSLINSVKEGGALLSKCVSCEERVYPKIITMSDLETLNGYPDGYSLHTTDTKYLQDEETFYQYENQIPAIGLVANKTYDFTLEYKIDAIITEDGVQTF